MRRDPVDGLQPVGEVRDELRLERHDADLGELRVGVE
jgi:hypothetical protein